MKHFWGRAQEINTHTLHGTIGSTKPHDHHGQRAWKAGENFKPQIVPRTGGEIWKLQGIPDAISKNPASISALDHVESGNTERFA